MHNIGGHKNFKPVNFAMIGSFRSSKTIRVIARDLRQNLSKVPPRNLAGTAMNMERLARGMPTGSPRKTAATAAKWRHDNFGKECVPVPTGTSFIIRKTPGAKAKRGPLSKASW